MNSTDTIIAPATAPGEGGIAVIRISGVNALEYLKKFFKPTLKNAEFDSHHLYHGLLVGNDQQTIDEVMAVYMAAPRTYTREDVVEIHSHGSQQIVKSIIHLYLQQGLRLASPGEFTYRAYINGRLDLSQAEAVSRLIKSNSDTSRRLALSQVGGGLSKLIYSFTKTIKHTLVLSEAWIDFPEEDLPEEDIAFIYKSVLEVANSVSAITDTFDVGRIQVEGASIMLVGEPNVGKSSLLNSLLGEDRAIVTDIPGTTRDLLEEGVYIAGLPVKLIDTAGLRDTDDRVEQEGIRRAQDKMGSADLVLLLVDGSDCPVSFDSYAFGKCIDYPTFLIVTKGDLIGKDIDTSASPYPVFHISSKTGQGLDRLKESISKFLLKDTSSSAETVMLTERRHYEALLKAHANLTNSLGLVDMGGSLDLLAFELREALFHLGQISGVTTTEDLLDDIFSGFCIGK
jgi:tRNA modification GTPase